MGWKVDFLANFQVVRVLDVWVGAQKVISLNTQAICHLVEAVLPELGRFNPVSMLVTRRFAFDAVKVHENVKHGSLLVLLSDQVGLCCQVHIRNGAFFATLGRDFSRSLLGCGRAGGVWSGHSCPLPLRLTFWISGWTTVGGDDNKCRQ